MVELVTFITRREEHIARACPSWLFYLFQRVRSFTSAILTMLTSFHLATRQYARSNDFRKFRRQLFHSSIARILQPLKPHMTKPRVTRCADGHFRRAIYGLGPYIADYPEQALLACIVQGYCARYVRAARSVEMYLSLLAGVSPHRMISTETVRGGARSIRRHCWIH